MGKGARFPMKMSEYLEAARRGAQRVAPARLKSCVHRLKPAPPIHVDGVTLSWKPEGEAHMGCGGGPVGPLVEETNRTGRKVFCVKFQREMPGLDEPPFDNHPLGQRIFENVSKEAWKMWLEQMKMIMNEYRLNLGTQEAQEFLLKQMEEYFFGEGAALPPGYVPPRSKN